MLPPSGCSILVETDELGSLASIVVDSTIYTETVIFKAAYWFTERFYLYLSREDLPKNIRIEIRPKHLKDTEQLEKICRNFCNSLIDYRVRHAVLEETGNIRDSLLRRAFDEGRKFRDPQKIKSNESHVPSPSQSYLEDALDIGHLTGAD